MRHPIRIKHHILTLAAALVFTACSSTNTVGKVKSAEGAVVNTTRSIDKTDNALANLKYELQQSRSKAIKDGAMMRGRDQYAEILKDVEASLAKARIELSKLKSANITSWQSYKTNLDQARLKMRESFNEELQPGLDDDLRTLSGSSVR